MKTSIGVALLALAFGVASPAMAGDRDDVADYIRARAADAAGAKPAAASGYAAALAANPGNAEIAARAYRAGLAAGDMALANRARIVLETAGVAPGDTALLRLAEAVAANDTAGAEAATATIAKGPFNFLAPSIRAWLRYRKDPAGALASLDAAGGNPLAGRFASETRALIDTLAARGGNGPALLRLLGGVDAGSQALRLDAAQMVAGAGRVDEARGLLAGDDPTVKAYRAALDKGIAPDTLGKGPVADARRGIARMYLRLAGTLSDGRVALVAIVLARAAQSLEPGNDRALLVLAQALTGSDLPLAALATLDQIGPDSPARREADMLRVDALQDAGRADEALALAKVVSSLPDAKSSDAQHYGDLLFSANKFDEAAAAYGLALARAGDTADWTLRLQYGGALERAGHWDKAEPELKRAVAMAPRSAVALNYLAYAQLEHGASPAETAKVLEQATALQPDSASILDSLAWSYFLGGQAARALPLLERAAGGDPGNSTINEHLGDVYWTTGRFYEARYAWRAAALTANDEEGQRLARKLAEGLPPAPARP